GVFPKNFLGLNKFRDIYRKTWYWVIQNERKSKMMQASISRVNIACQATGAAAAAAAGGPSVLEGSR
ncbi:MAG: hypothetical protein QNL11_10715, partial [Desulfobacterales bacterium]|nr:hypothetical protein [Desulfobacterales bacterium]